MNTEMIRLWQLISPSLPVGAFHYSQGLEQAVDCGWVNDAVTAETWIAGILQHSLVSVDLPIIKRVHGAWKANDEELVRHWDRVSRACRETSELRDEDRQMGMALCRLAQTLDEPMPGFNPGFPAAFAVLAVNNGISVDTTLLGYAWAWCENQVLASVKLVPLGHRRGQLMLRSLGAGLDSAVTQALACTDDSIGVTAPGFVLASARHETQHTRLFRS
ncbi:MAG: urease accessory protein UreF [Gammaproteobacteria bacterium]|nr:urease accessory protein UreF [Gammaproteobacteria bacterium]